MPNPFVGVTGGSEENRLAVARAADRASGLIQRSGKSPFEARVSTPNTGPGSGIRGFSVEGAQAYREAVRLRRQFDPGFIAPPLPAVSNENLPGAVITFEDEIPRMPSFSREQLDPKLREQFDKLTPREKLLLELETPTLVARMNEREIEAREGQRGTLMSTPGGGVVRIQPDDSVESIIEPGEPGPQTDIGRLRAELERGQITQEDFDREVARRERGQGPLVQIGSDLTTATTTQIEKDILESAENLDRFDRMMQDFEPEFLEAIPQRQAAAGELGERLGISGTAEKLGAMSPERRAKFESFRAATEGAFTDFLARFGAALTPAEIERARSAFPSMEDSATRFQQKIESGRRLQLRSVAKLNYIRARGIDRSAVDVDQIPSLVESEFQRLVQQMSANPSDPTEQELARVGAEVARIFGLPLDQLVELSE